MAHSDLASEALAAWLAGHYALRGLTGCQLLRSYTNDVYVVRTLDRHFILKVYGANWRTEAEIGYEVALLRHLAARGLAIPAPVAGRDEGFVYRLPDANGCRCAALFEYAEGEKPQPPFTARLYAAFGRAIARMHALSTDFTTACSRPSLDLPYLVDAPLAQVLPLLPEPADRTFLTRLVLQIKDRITMLAAQGLDWGPIHGDATLDNLHLLADGEVILYDFDSGGPGWRAADLQGWAIHSEAYRESWNAFSAGYAEIRPLPRPDVLAAPYLTLAWDIWGIKIDLDQRILPQGRERTQHYLTEQMTRLRDRETEFAFLADRKG